MADISLAGIAAARSYWLGKRDGSYRHGWEQWKEGRFMTAPSAGKIKWAVSDAGRAVPNLEDADTGEFWRAVQEHRLTYQVCRMCNGLIFYPRAHCTHCLSEDLEVRESSGNGTVYSYTVIRRNPDPAFAAAIPYIVALVDLDEGFRMLTHLKMSPDIVSVGDRVAVDWETVEGVELPVFVGAL